MADERRQALADERDRVVAMTEIIEAQLASGGAAGSCSWARPRAPRYRRCAGGVLACRDRLPAATAVLPGGAGRVGVQVGRAARGVVAVRAEADRAGIGRGNAGAAGAEVIQVGPG